MTKRIERIILLTLFILCGWSIVAVLSAGLNYPGHESLYVKQSAAVAIGFVLLFLLKNFSYKFIEELSPLFYLISIFLLVSLMFFGTEIHGSRRWFNLGIIYFQPSEFAKFALIFFTSFMLQKKNSLFLPLLALVSLAFLVAIQPDAGTAFVFFPVFLGMLSVSRLNVRWLAALIVLSSISLIVVFAQSYLYFRGSTLLQLRFILIPIVISALIAVLFNEMKRINKRLSYTMLAVVLLLFWAAAGFGVAVADSLKEYHQKRIVSFIIPELDPTGVGYSTRQSILAVGSGGVFGRGFFQGTQTQLGFLPARHNDLIFSTIAEETGFIGASVLLLLLALLGWQMIKIINRTEDYGGQLIASGVFCLFVSQVALNVFVAMGLVPVIGIQLPFVSYGGSSLVLFFALSGVLLNINRRVEVIAR